LNVGQKWVKLVKKPILDVVWFARVESGIFFSGGLMARLDADQDLDK